MQQVRVAQIMGKMMGGGVEQVILNYYKYINREQVQFDFIVDSDSVNVPSERIQQMGGNIYVIPPYQELRAYKAELNKLFKKNNWPIVHSNINSLSVFPLSVAKKCNIPVRIAHSHSTAGKGEVGKNIIKDILKQFSNLYPTNKFACSEVAGKWLFGNNQDFDIIYNAIELDKFTYNAHTRNRIRTELGVGDETLVLGNVGRIVKQKNQKYLMYIFSELLKKRSSAVLVFVGTGKLEESLKQYAVEMNIDNNVFFLGQRDDVYNLYQAFDVFCLPSLYEGLGIVAIEAQYSGLPCIVSDKVPREVNISHNVSFLALSDKPNWVNALNQHVPGKRLPVCKDSFENYDIKLAGKKLTNKYLEFVEEI